jgi:NADP-dependent aldehyde dehydrogenase
VKAHPGHPRLSRAVFDLASEVISRLGLPSGVLRIVEGAGIDVGVRLVRHPAIAAVAFTGSFKGGAALQAEANARPQPIPFYGELGSINPVVALPKAVAARGAELAQALANSIGMGSGQFCTSPGVLLVFDDAASQDFVQSLKIALAALTPHAMLTPAIRKGFDSGVARLAANPRIRTLLAGDGSGPAPRPVLVETDAASFVADHALREEVFGPLAIVVRVHSADEAIAALKAVGGSLTVTLWGAEDLRLRRAGRAARQPRPRRRRDQTQRLRAPPAAAHRPRAGVRQLSGAEEGDRRPRPRRERRRHPRAA